jgi:outer membrane lipoprotein SlyB
MNVSAARLSAGADKICCDFALRGQQASAVERYSEIHSLFEEIIMIKHRRTSRLSSSLLVACLALAGFSTQAQTPAPTPAQIKAQQDLAAAQAAADKANREAAESQAKMQNMASQKAAQKAADAEAAQKLQADKSRLTQVAALCDSCGIVTELRSEKRKGKGGALGIIGGAVVGGALGNQVGDGKGKTVATVGGVVGGAVVGNEIQKRMSKKTIHITSIQMKDGSTRSYESEKAPTWSVGNSVKLDTAANTVTKI